MSVWKQFCRRIESKDIVRHFGDLVPVIDGCALFEFTNDQIHNAQMHVPQDLTEDEHYPIPPFPFPSMCMVGPGGVIVLHSPLMDEKTSVLEFEVMMYQALERGKYMFQKATCVVSATRLDDDGHFPMELRDTSGMFANIYWDDDTPIVSPNVLDKVVEDELDHKFQKGIVETDRQLEKARDLGDSKEIVRLEARREEGVKAYEELNQLRDRKKEAVAKWENQEAAAVKIRIDGLTDAFYLGLQEVNWINHPDHFTIEVNANPALKKKKKKGRIRRLHERPSHIILNRGDIEERWRTVHQGGTHAPPIPHLRRGHYRTLTAERWKDKKGQRIWVRASHVGGECVEWRDGEVSYKVL